VSVRLSLFPNRLSSDGAAWLVAPFFVLFPLPIPGCGRTAFWVRLGTVTFARVSPTHHGRCDRGTPERKSKRMPISEKTVVQ